MPIFEYICGDCKHPFETLLYGDEIAQCPKCHSQKLAPQLSVFAVAGKSGSLSSTSASPEMEMGGCGSCGDPRGPGACSMPDFDA